MLYIIRTEDHRTIGEIQWDHSAENMEEPLKISSLIKDKLTDVKIRNHRLSLYKKKSDGTKYTES